MFIILTVETDCIILTVNMQYSTNIDLSVTSSQLSALLCCFCRRFQGVHLFYFFNMFKILGFKRKNGSLFIFIVLPESYIKKCEETSLFKQATNADIRVKTIDVKRQYHVMARVLFQDQAIGSDKPISRIHTTIETNLKLPKNTTTKLLRFQKPISN